MELGSYFVSARTNKRHHHHHLSNDPGKICPRPKWDLLRVKDLLSGFHTHKTACPGAHGSLRCCSYWAAHNPLRGLWVHRKSGESVWRLENCQLSNWTATLRINLNVEGCAIVADPVHGPSDAPLLLPLLLSHNLPLPSSIVWSVHSFFASQTLHNIKNLKKKFRRCKWRNKFFPFIFCFKRELNPYSPLSSALSSALTSAHELKPLPSPSAHPSAHTS